MTIRTSGNTNEKICEYCGSDKMYMTVTKSGTPYPKWHNIQSITTGRAF